jgi:hypothetical protein
MNFSIEKNKWTNITVYGNVTYETSGDIPQDVYISSISSRDYQTEEIPAVMEFKQAGTKPFRIICTIPPRNESVSFSITASAYYTYGVIVTHTVGTSADVDILIQIPNDTIIDDNDDGLSEKNAIGEKQGLMVGGIIIIVLLLFIIIIKKKYKKKKN